MGLCYQGVTTGDVGSLSTKRQLDNETACQNVVKYTIKM